MQSRVLASRNPRSGPVGTRCAMGFRESENNVASGGPGCYLWAMLRRRFLALSAAATATSARGVGASTEPPVARFGLITDVQYADADPKGERHYRESIPKLKEAVADLAKEKLPFTLHLGDTIDRDFASYGAIVPLFGGLGHPLMNLLGNHDFDIADERKPEVVKRLGMPADFYSFTHGGVRFVMLDTNEVSTFKHAADSAETREGEMMMRDLAGAPNAKPWNSGVSKKQLAWLEQELAEAAAAEQMVIVCGHHPLLPLEMHTAWNHGEILAVLKRHPCVRAYLCGHNHGGNQVTSPAGIPCITFKSLLHEPGVTAYAVIRLDSDRLTIDGRGREVSRTIALRA